MSDKDEKPEAEDGEKDEKSGKWKTSTKVGAAIGSAAVAAALIYAGRHKMRQMDDFKTTKSDIKYENEPEEDEDEGDSEE